VGASASSAAASANGAGVASTTGSDEGNGAGPGLGGESPGAAPAGLASARRSPAVRATVYGASPSNPSIAIVRSATTPRVATPSRALPAGGEVAVPARVHVPQANDNTVVASSVPLAAAGVNAAAGASDAGPTVDAQTFPVYTPQLQPQPLESFTPDTATLGAAPDGWVILPSRIRSSP
jgi:hypothetical protein